MQGKGKFLCVDGSFYEGEWVENERDGRGAMVYKDGKVKEGLWSKHIFIH